MMKPFFLFCVFFSLNQLALNGQVPVPSSPLSNDASGPYSQLIIRGGTLINSTGAPPIGPVDIVIEGNTIKSVQVVGYPDVQINPEDRPVLAPDGVEIDAEGKFMLPGFIDMHGHIGGQGQGAGAEYVFKLWMGHGITTIRDPACGNGLSWVLSHKRLSEEGKITAPHILAYTVFGQGAPETISTPEQARQWVIENAEKGADGIKFFGLPPVLFEAALNENKKLGLRSACHHAQMEVGRWNVIHSAKAGLTTMEHWYGLPEALFIDRTLQNYPLDYNYQNEQHRFGEAGKLWKQAAPPYSDHWNEVMNELIDLDFTIDPTFNIYEASRDLHRARRAEWHEEYTLPSLWRFYQPSKISHGSYWHFWGTEEEVEWKENYKLWMTFVNEYKNRGGRVTTGSDSGFIFQLYGFGYIRELELLREAGFHPLEIIRSATLYGAEALGIDHITGSIEVGKRADIIIVDENPLENLKVLYGTGAIKLTDSNEVIRVGGVSTTIKGGMVYDAKKLLEDVKKMVREAKQEEDFEIAQPGKN
jgi:hypothetical protein